MADHEQQRHKEQPQLPDPYRKTRRWYVFLSSLLLIYAAIGLELVAKPIEGKPASTELIFYPNVLEGLGIKILSPQAAPWVLFFLVLYFANRVDVEWRLCAQEILQFPPTWRDHMISHGLAVIAIAYPVIQWILDRQIADYLFPKSSLEKNTELYTLLLGACLASLVILPSIIMWKKPTKLFNSSRSADSRKYILLHWYLPIFIGVVLFFSLRARAEIVFSQINPAILKSISIILFVSLIPVLYRWIKPLMNYMKSRCFDEQ